MNINKNSVPPGSHDAAYELMSLPPRTHLALELLNFTAICPRTPFFIPISCARAPSSIRHISTQRSHCPQRPLHIPRLCQRDTSPAHFHTCHAAQMNLDARTTSSELLADSLEKPLLDDRTYRVIRLPNKLEALIIHDPATDKASAAVDVRAGSLSDAKDLPGMAHAVEHMLFLGNEKYPSENDYTQYLAAYAGSHNAFTGQTSTNYFFEMSVRPEDKVAQNGPGLDRSTNAFHGALDRFSQFFVKPLFLEDSLDRELRAVDSENKKNLQSDTWRLQQLRRSLSNPEHPNSNFSTGNLKTLRDDPVARGVNIRSEFIRFYDEQYSANRMKLVILGREPLDELQTWAEELFANVPNKNLKPNHWDMPLLTEKELLTEIHARPVTEMRQLELSFPYPDEEELWESHPERYISHLIGHEGPGSILASIKAKGWASGLSAGSRTVCKGSGVFDVAISLTQEGLKNYQEIVKIIFQYISILHETPPQEWIFNESRDLAEVDFRFQQKRSASSTTSAMAGIMQKPIARDRLLNGPTTMRKFDAAAISRGIKALNADNFRLLLVSQDPLPGEVLKEKWYGTEYTINKLSDDFRSSIKKAASSTASERPENLFLPGRNEFVPTRLDVHKKEVEKPTSRPKLVRNDEHVRLWFKKDDQFWVPKATYFLKLRTPMCRMTARNAAMSFIFTALVQDSLQEYSYDAELAGLEYDLDSTSLGLECTITGYNDKMAVLLEKVLSSTRNLVVKDDRFEIIKERIERGFRNRGFAAPYQQIGEFTQWLTSEHGFLGDQCLQEMPNIKAEDIRNFQPLLLGQLHIEALAHGNLYLEDALKLTDLTEKLLATRTLPPSQWRIQRSMIVPDGSNYVYSRMLPDPANINHAIEYVLHIGDIADRDRRARLLLLDQMVHEPAFDRLRTKEQLGYVVFSNAIRSATRLSFRFIIQSEREPEYLESRIDSFLRWFKGGLRDMDSEKFEKHRQSKINERLETIKNLGRETDRYLIHICNEMYHFEETVDDAERLAKVTKEEMIEFFDQYIDPDSKRRAKVSVYLRAKANSEEVANNISAAEQKEGFFSLLSQFFTAIEVPVEPEKVQGQFKNVDISKGNQSDILTALRAYLAKDAGLAEEKVTAIIEQAKLMLGQILSQLGIKSADAGKTTPPEAVPPPAIEPVIVEDVHAFKASLALSAGARPLRDLSEYEEEPSCKL